MVNKKKRTHVDVEDVIERPWCYYCERDFDDGKVLLSHQKAKHFKCDKCNRRLNTAGGLSVHMQQVHKETLTCVENAIEGRQGVEPEVFGMMGVPEDLVNAHRQRILNEFFKREADRRAATGNPPPGQRSGEPSAKKRKMETPEEIKARAAEHRAKRQAERQAEKEGKVVPKSTSNTPVPGPTPAQTNAPIGTPSEFGISTLASYDHMKANLPQFTPPYPGLPLQTPIGGGFVASLPVQQPGCLPQHASPYSFSPPQGAPFPPPPPFMPPVHSPMAGQMPGAMPPRPSMRYSPSTERQPTAPTQSPLQSAPGLPARPSFDLPNFNREDMQRMHTGQVPPPPPNTATHSQPPAMPHKPALGSYEGATKEAVIEAPKPTYNKNLYTLEDVEAMLKETKSQFKSDEAAKLLSEGATKEAAVDAPVASGATPATMKERDTSSKKKKSKPATSVLVFSDDRECPEEKKAKWGKYALKYNDGPEFVQGEIGGAVTGVAVDEDTVLDVQD